MVVMTLRVLIATAELDPLVKVGGLGEATAGLARSLSNHGAQVDIVVPDYPVPLAHQDEWHVDLPWWATGGTIRSGRVPGVGTVHAVSVEGIERPDPYIDPGTGHGWADNERRFSFFSAAVAAVARRLDVDLLHLNDWHTALAVAWFPPQRTVLTIHNLAHQGTGDLGWLGVIGDQASAFEHLGSFNPLAGAVRLCNRVVVVSPGYAREILSQTHGCGLEGELRARGQDLVGIRNGVDTELWDPAADPRLPANYSGDDLAGKEVCRHELRRDTGLDGKGPTVGMVSRFVDQKGIDFLTDITGFLAHLPASLIVHGSGERRLVELAKRAAAQSPDRVRVVDGYDEDFAHLLMAGSDLLFMPSRYEPCGLTQMQAMRFGTIPVVTAVGGLADTVIDVDADPRHGTGFVARRVSTSDLVDALHRASRGWHNHQRRRAVQRRGMAGDWSWNTPARQYLRLYEEVTGPRCPPLRQPVPLPA
jgi:starch synthase